MNLPESYWKTMIVDMAGNFQVRAHLPLIANNYACTLTVSGSDVTPLTSALPAQFRRKGAAFSS